MRSCPLFMMALVAAVGVAQAPPVLRLAGRAHLPAVRIRAEGLAAADLTGDGLVDVLVGSAGGAALFRGDGAARFFHEPSLTGGRAFAVHTVGDVDGDGDLDVVVAGGILLNDGLGALVSDPAALTAVPLGHVASALGDLDGDGDLDLALVGTYGSASSGLWLGLNDGAGVFAARSFDAVGYHDVRIGDADGDGDLDLFAFGNACVLFVNHGGALLRGPVIPMTPTVFRAHLLDFDGDGDLDVAGGPGASLLRNDGASFVDVTGTATPGTIPGVADVAVFDADRDGDPDLFVAATGTDRLLVNLGGRFVDAPLPADSYTGTAAVAADVDRDGDLDVLTGAWSCSLYLNDGRAGFARATRSPLDVDVVARASGLALGDLDGDGILDLVVSAGDGAAANHTPQFRSACLLGDGRGDFVDASAVAWSAQRANATGVALGDVDGDGDLDAVFGCHGGVYGPGIEVPAENELWRNDGRGRFVRDLAAFGSAAEPTQGVELADLDGDGDPDLHEVCGWSRIAWNDGTGRFATETVFPRPLGAIVDVDGDGDRDFVAVSPTVAVMVNDGAGVFTPGFTSGDVFRYAAFADFDGDADVDFVGRSSTRVALARNDGAGRFTVGPVIGLWRSSLPIDAGDVDADGDVDVWAGGYLYRNDGTGAFVQDVAASADGSRLPTPGLVADLDQDGDPDLVGTAQLQVGLARQVTVLRLPTIGAGFAVGLTESTDTSRGRTVVPILAAAGARIPVPPFGVLGVEAAGAVFLPPATIGTGALTAEIAPGIPASTALVGGPLFVQALFLCGPDPARWRLGNTVREAITAF